MRRPARHTSPGSSLMARAPSGRSRMAVDDGGRLRVVGIGRQQEPGMHDVVRHDDDGDDREHRPRRTAPCGQQRHRGHEVGDVRPPQRVLEQQHGERRPHPDEQQSLARIVDSSRGFETSVQTMAAAARTSDERFAVAHRRQHLAEVGDRASGRRRPRGGRRRTGPRRRPGPTAATRAGGGRASVPPARTHERRTAPQQQHDRPRGRPPAAAGLDRQRRRRRATPMTPHARPTAACATAAPAAPSPRRPRAPARRPRSGPC